MIRPISVVSDGYLSITKRVLVIAVAGYLNFGGESSTPPSMQGGSIGQEDLTHHKNGDGRGGLVNDDEEVIAITLQAFMICRE